jgi:membrane protein implicated in regulation of membrane protease activity
MMDAVLSGPYWLWIVLGVALVGLEMFIASFTVLWFGLGALVVGLILLAAPTLVLPWQLLLWLVFSIGFAVFWFRYFKPRMVDKTKAGIPREAVIGITGQVIRPPREHRRGLVRFTTPVLGDDEWEFICEDVVAPGDRVAIREVSGNTLIVHRRG